MIEKIEEILLLLGLTKLWVSIIIIIALLFIWWWSKILQSKSIKTYLKYVILFFIIIIPISIGLLKPAIDKFKEVSPPKDKISILLTNFYQAPSFERGEAEVFVQNIKLELEKLEESMPIKTLYSKEILGESTEEEEKGRARELGRNKGAHLVIWGSLIRDIDTVKILPNISVSNPLFGLREIEKEFPKPSKLISTPVEIESKKALLKEEIPELIKMIVGIANYYFQNFDKAYNYFSSINENIYYPEQLHYIGAIQIKTGDFGGYPEATNNFTKVKDYYESIQDSIKLAESYGNLATSLLGQGNLRGAIEYYEKGSEIFELKNNKNELLDIYNNLSTVYIKQRKLDEALKLLKWCSKHGKKRKGKTYQASVYVNIGTVYLSKGIPDSSLFYYKKSLKVLKNHFDKATLSLTYTNMAIGYFMKKDYENTIKYGSKSIENNKKLDNKKGLSHNYNIVGLARLKHEDFENAIEDFQTAVEYKEKIGDSLGLAEVKSNLGIAFNKIERYEKAMETFEEVSNYFKRKKYVYGVAKIYGNIADTHEKKGNLEEALKYAEDALNNFLKSNAHESEIKQIEKQIQRINEKINNGATQSK